MKLYLMRHGPAGSRQDWSGEDSLRPLTPQGADQVGRVVDGLAAIGVTLDVVITSPYARAEQTAAIVADRLGTAEPIRDQELVPGFGPSGLEAVLADLGEREHVMVVGHEPDFSTVLHHLTGARAHFKKSAIACVALDTASPARGSLEWFAPPKVLAPGSR